MDDIRIFRCHRCGVDLDTDLSEPKLVCRNCGSSRWEGKRDSHLLTKRDVLILYLDTGIWIKNSEGETWIDRKLDEINEIEDADTQDKAEREFLETLRNSVDIPFEMEG